MQDSADIRQRLKEAGPTIWSELSNKAADWMAPVLARLEKKKNRSSFPKTFNDPVWGVITFMPWETLLLDSALLQRLRGVHQLGLAHHVYPSAVHDRLEHSRGAVEAAERMMTALARNAEFRKEFEKKPDNAIPQPSALDRASIRLGALLHDIGHGPFSHATESLIRDRHSGEFDAVEMVLRDSFDGVTKIASAETIAAILIFSEPMKEVFEHPKFTALQCDHTMLAAAVVARILSSRSYLDATYLSGVVSGPLDADKLDYMPRDSHHAGLPVGLDLVRLISKLEVVTVTTENAPNDSLRKRAENCSTKRFYEIGISLSGLGAYEQLVVARVMLFDRLYYHHKVRAAEAMARRLIELAEEERAEPFSLKELFSEFSDDTMIGLLGGHFTSNVFRSGGTRSSALAKDLQNRSLYYRAFAFAARFIEGLGGLPKQEELDTRALSWSEVINVFSNEAECRQFATQVYNKCRDIATAIPSQSTSVGDLQPEHIIVDFPSNRVVAGGSHILTRTEDDEIGTPNLFFDPERWSQAYQHQKQCGFVFTKRDFLPIVAIASRIVFFDRFQLVMGVAADRASKTSREAHPEWLPALVASGVCSAECAEILVKSKPNFKRITPADLAEAFPVDWRSNDPGLLERFCNELKEGKPEGFPASVHSSVCKTIAHIASFLDVAEKGGIFVGLDHLTEKDFQGRLRDHIRSRSGPVQEGSEVGGGESDLIVCDNMLIENKVKAETQNPFEQWSNTGWQARRYSIALCKSVFITCVAYKPKNEAAILELSKRLRILRIEGESGNMCEIRAVIPWGHSVPSRAKAPEKTGGA